MSKRKYQTTLEMFRRPEQDSMRDESAGSVCGDVKWRRERGVLWGMTGGFVLPDGDGAVSVASFDADGTLVNTLSNRGLAKHANDWKFISSRVPKKLSEVHASQAVVVIFTNQGGVESGQTPEGMIRTKMNGIARGLRVPCVVFAACGYDRFRKPSPGMWELFLERVMTGRSVDMACSYFVGDAAGRGPSFTRKRADFSDSDRKFAVNAGLKFFTPEEFFDGDGDASLQDLELRGLDPKQELEAAFVEPLEPSNALTSLDDGEQQLIVLIGYPGAGKSTFSTKVLEKRGVARVNMDTLGTKAKCLEATKLLLGRGKSVVVDNTNPRVDSRQPFVLLAKKRNIKARAFWFQGSRSLAEHLNALREKQTGKRRVPQQAYAVYEAGFTPPTEEEGFDDITIVRFVPQFEDDTHKKLFLELS